MSPRIPAHNAHEVRLIRERFARMPEIRNGNGVIDFGTPQDGWVWLVERIAVKAAAAATVEIYVGGGFAGVALAAATSGSEGFSPEILVPERSPLTLDVSGLAGTELVEANVQMVIARKGSQRVDSPERMVALLTELTEGLLVTSDGE